MLESSRQRVALHVGRLLDRRQRLVGTVEQVRLQAGKKTTKLRRQAGQRVGPLQRRAGEKATRLRRRAVETIKPRAADAARSFGRRAIRAGRATGAGAANLGRGAFAATGASLAALGTATEGARRVGGRLRPRPFSDAGLFVLLILVTVVALAVSIVLGFSLAAWAATAPHDVLLASAGAVVVGLVFLLLMFLVFASRRGARRPRRSRGAELPSASSPLPQRARTPRRWEQEPMRDAA